MTLTQDQITAGQTYTVTIDQSLSAKRFRDAVALVKKIGTREDHTATYDGASKTWTVVLPHDSFMGRIDLQTLVSSYDSAVEVAGTAQPAPAPAPAQAKAARAPRGHVRNGIDWAEYGDGFSPLDERPYMGS